MIFEPLEDRVFVTPAEAPKKYDSNVLDLEIAPSVQKQIKPSRGVIAFAGPGTEKRPMTLKPGDQVIFGRFAGTEFEDDEDKKIYLIMRTADVFARIAQPREKDPEA